MVKNYQQLWGDVANANDEAEAVGTLTEILVDKEGRDFISQLGRKDAELCIEILDRGIADHNLKIAEKQIFLATLRKLAGNHARLPGSMIITGEIKVADKILASGGFADVRSGEYMGRLVAMKTLRVAERDDVPKIRKLVGVQGDMEKGQFTAVSEWMAQGNIVEYIKGNFVNRLELLHGAAQGLKYLHDANLIHGDLKGANILMSNDTPPRACLADFGFMTMVFDPSCQMSCSTQLEGGTLMFMPPELLAPSKFGVEVPKPTPQADVYAFGLVIFQVLTGEIPFRSLGPVGFVYPVVEGLRPAKPENASAIGFSDSLWDFTQCCWDGDMNLRPQIVEVVTCLDGAAADWDGVMPPHVQARNVIVDAEEPKEPMSDTMKHRGIFQTSSSADLEASTYFQCISGPLSYPSTLSTRHTEPLQEEPQEVVAPKSPNEPQPEPRRQEGSYDDPHVGEHYPHLEQTHNPPPTRLPEEQATGFEYLKLKFCEFLGLLSEN